jgi:iron complex outermembrane recepter protein
MKLRCLLLSTVSAAFCFATAAHSQDQVAQAQGGIEEIIVTAQKRSQTLLEVPVTVTAYTGDFLKRIGVEEFDALSAFVPGLVIQEQSVNNPGFVIRGITSDSGQANIAPRVSVYLDGIDVSRSRGSIFELHDIERVEVVKGPQATLFGSAASVGAISVITAKPKPGFEGSLSLGSGNFDEIKTRGHITGGSDKVQGRLAWIYKNRDGFIENFAGQPGSQTPLGPREPALNGTDTFAGRASARFAPTDTFTLDIVANYQRDTPPASSFKSRRFAPTGGTTSPNTYAELGGSPLTVEHLGGRLGINRDSYGITATADYQSGGPWSFEAISGFRKFDSLEVFDADGTAAYWLEFAEDAKGEQLSQEVRANYTGDSLNAFIGASYFHEDGEQRVPLSTDLGVYVVCSGGVPNVPCFRPDGRTNSALPVRTPYTQEFSNYGNFDTWSVYADASYDVLENVELTVGLRYLSEDRTSGASGIAPPTPLTGQPLLAFSNTNGVIVEVGDNYDAFIPRFNVNYRAAQNLSFYATVGKGRRSPVIDVAGRIVGGAPTAIPTFLPAEIVWNYEGGFKSILADNKLTIDGAAFYQEYSSFQTSALVNGRVTPLNGGSAKMKGAELAVSAQPIESLNFFATGSYIDAQFDQTDSAGNRQVFAGNRFRLQPEWAFSSGLTFETPVSSLGTAYVTPIWTYRSKVFFEDRNTPIAGFEIAQPGLHLVNLRFGLRNEDKTWEFAGYVENVFDKEYIIDAGNTGGSFGTPTFIAGPPRFYGVEVIYNF